MMQDDIQKELQMTFLEEAEELLVAWESICLKLGEQLDSEAMIELFRVAHTLKGSSRAVGFDHIGSFIHEVEEFIKHAQTNISINVDHFLRALLMVHEVLGEWLNNNPPKKDLIDQIFQFFNASISKILHLEEGAVASDCLTPDLQLVKDEPSKEKQESSKNAVVRVQQYKVDKMINIVGELSNQLSILDFYFRNKRTEEPAFIQALSSSRKYAKNMQESVMGLSMQNLERLFQRLERAGLDVARSGGKQVSIIKTGTAIELDKMVIDQIADPLIHVIRNATDHGIENPNERLSKNKTAQGKIWLSAELSSGSVQITVKDDGAGLNQNRILSKAIEKNLIKNETKLSQDEIFQLILLPGFSTKDQVTDVSGRGVGMDVVNSTLKNLGGTLKIQSQLGVGTTFIITIPTNFSLIEALLVEFNDVWFGVPLKEFSEIVDLDTFKLEKNSLGHSYFNLRDEIVPLNSMQEFLKFSEKSMPSKKVSKRIALINRGAQKPVAYEINSINGQSNLFVKPLKGQMEKMFGISGTAILPDGKASLVVNLNELSKKYEQSITKESKYA